MTTNVPLLLLEKWELALSAHFRGFCPRLGGTGQPTPKIPGGGRYGA